MAFCSSGLSAGSGRAGACPSRRRRQVAMRAEAVYSLADSARAESSGVRCKSSWAAITTGACT